MDTQEEITARYNEEAKTYREEALLVNFEAETFFNKLVNILQVLFPDKESSINILDIGAGNGMLTEIVYKEFRNAQITMLDFSEEMLISAKNYFYANNLNINAKYVVSDFINADFPNEKYNLIISSFALHHVRNAHDLANVYQKIANCLSDQGVFLCIDYYLGNTDSEAKEQAELAIKKWTENFNSEEKANFWADILKAEDSPATLHTIFSLLNTSGMRILLSKENGIMTTLYGLSRRDLNYFSNSQLDSMLLFSESNIKNVDNPKTYKIDRYPF